MKRVCEFPLWLTNVDIKEDIKFEKQSNGVLKKNYFHWAHSLFQLSISCACSARFCQSAEMHARYPPPHVPEGHGVFTQGLIELILKCNLAGAKTCEHVYHEAHLN